MPRERNETICTVPIGGDYAYSVKEHYRHATCKECGRAGLIWRRNANGRYILTTHESGDFHDCAARRYNVPTPTPMPTPTPEPTPSVAPAEIDYDTLASVVARMVESRITVPTPEIDYDRIVASTAALMREREPQAIRIERINTPSVTVEFPHPAFAEVLAYINARLNVWIYGPAGTGKTTAVENIANLLGLPFYSMSVGPMTQEYAIFGHVAPDGTFVPGPLFKPYTEGGLFNMDEIDAGSPDCLLAINQALANGQCMFGGKMYAKHPDFVCTATANTIGNGASRRYNGRSEIDAATLNRFEMVEWDYDLHLERRIAQSYDHPDAMRWHDYVHAVRAAVDALGLEYVVSTREIVSGCKALMVGVPFDTIAENRLWRRMDSDAALKVKAQIR